MRELAALNQLDVGYKLIVSMRIAHEYPACYPGRVDWPMPVSRMTPPESLFHRLILLFGNSDLEVLLATPDSHPCLKFALKRFPLLLASYWYRESSRGVIV